MLSQSHSANTSIESCITSCCDKKTCHRNHKKNVQCKRASSLLSDLNIVVGSKPCAMEYI